MEIPYHIASILKEKKITDYLESKGIVPSRESGGKKIYHCPLHEGDNDPSFVLYTGTDYENYFCYGCKKSGNIINLLSDMEDIPLRSSVKKLIKGIDISEVAVMNSLVKALEGGIMVDNNTSIERLVLKVNRVCYNYLEYVDFDKEEVSFFGKVFKIIDDVCRIRDIDTLIKIDQFIISAIDGRIDKYNARLENKIINGK